MTGPLRLGFPGALYHVTSRCNRRSLIYHDDTDRTAWLDVLALMCYHFHLMLETVEPSLGLAMRYLNPLRAKMVGSLDEWPWSSHWYFVGQAPLPSWLELDWLLAQFGTSRAQAIAAYQT